MIVSDIAGTTRDATDSFIENEYGKFIFIDTAGIRRKSKVDERVEKFSVMQGIVFDEHYDMVPILNMPDIITRFKAMRNYDMKKRVANDRNIVHKILCVDSSENARIIEQFALEKVGFVTETACDGIDALEKTKESRFDLIICANEMPRMNGMTLLENLRRSEVYKDVPFIVVFAEQNNELFEEYAENGANAWLDKSVFNRNEMIAKVKELLNA